MFDVRAVTYFLRTSSNIRKTGVSQNVPEHARTYVFKKNLFYALIVTLDIWFFKGW